MPWLADFPSTITTTIQVPTATARPRHSWDATNEYAKNVKILVCIVTGNVTNEVTSKEHDTIKLSAVIYNKPTRCNSGSIVY